MWIVLAFLLIMAIDITALLVALVILVAWYLHRRSRRDDDGIDPPSPVTNVKLEIKER